MPHYSYDPTYQTLTRTTLNGEEIQRFYLPRVDIEKVLMVLFHQSSKDHLAEEDSEDYD